MFEPFVPFQRLRMFAGTSTQKCILSSDTSAELLRAFIIFGLERPMTKHQSGWYQKCGKASLENIMLSLRESVWTSPKQPQCHPRRRKVSRPETVQAPIQPAGPEVSLPSCCCSYAFGCFSLIIWIISSSSSHLFFLTLDQFRTSCGAWHSHQHWSKRKPPARRARARTNLLGRKSRLQSVWILKNALSTSHLVNYTSIAFKVQQITMTFIELPLPGM